MIPRGRAMPLVLSLALGLGGILVTQPVPQASGAASSLVCKTWKVVPTPPLDGYSAVGVSGASNTDVWAVGGNFSSNAPPLAMHWDGRAWTQFPVANGFLQDVADISPNDAWAVGPGGYSIYVQHWDGNAWSPVKAPSPGFNYVYGVDAASSDDVWMVGNYTRSDFTVQPLTEHWDGRAWKIVQAEELTYGGVLYKVSVVSSDDVWAVGYQGTSNAFEFQPLIEHWDGVVWSVIPAFPPPSGTDNQLYSVAAVSSTDVWAVGIYGGQAKPLIEHWDGASWTLVRAPTLPGGNELFGVAVASASDVWAVGKSIDPHSGNYRPLTMHWDGGTWTPFPAPPLSVDGSFNGVWALSSQEVLTVGASIPDDMEPLVDRSRGPCG
jgi:hypothetical protein